MQYKTFYFCLFSCFALLLICPNLILSIHIAEKRCDDDNDDYIALLRFLRLSRKYNGGLAALFYGGLTAKPQFSRPAVGLL